MNMGTCAHTHELMVFCFVPGVCSQSQENGEPNLHEGRMPTPCGRLCEVGREHLWAPTEEPAGGA